MTKGTPIPAPTRSRVESDVQILLAERFCPPEWVYLPQVSNGTGGAHRRTADGVAMNCYPSRGLEVHGFEIKVSRADWIREVRDPEKSVAVQKYCNRWWAVVSNSKIVEPGELPATWGLMAPWRNGLKVLTPAPALEPKDLSRTFIASILRNAAAVICPQAKIDEAFKRGMDEAHKAAEQAKTQAHDFTVQELKRLQEAVDEFEEASGVRINKWNGGRIGEAVQTIMQCGKNPLVALRHQRKIVNDMVVSLDGTIHKLEKESGDNE